MKKLTLFDVGSLNICAYVGKDGKHPKFLLDLECADDGSVIECVENNRIITDKINGWLKDEGLVR